MDGSRQHFRADLSTLLLAALQGEALYGYAIAKKLEAELGGEFSFREGTLYPVLHELEKDGLIEGEWRVEGEPRPRRYYRLTENGRTMLARRMGLWSQFARGMSRLFSGDVDERPGHLPDPA